MESDIEVIIAKNIAGGTLVTLSEKFGKSECVVRRINWIQYLIL